MTLYIDIETYSPIPIKHGVYRYAEKAEVLLLAYALDRSRYGISRRRITELSGIRTPPIFSTISRW